MADHQRIHPVPDPEVAPTPTAPLVPKGESRSDEGSTTPPTTPAAATGNTTPHPPFRRTIPLAYSRPPKKRSCCCKCLCWSFCLLFLLILIIAIVGVILYLVFQPKLPKYSIDGIQITSFNLGNDDSLYAEFNVNITATNPNKKIGIYYESGSLIDAWYEGTKLCNGSFPKFYQGHQNTTELEIPMTGQTQNATALLTSLQAQEQTGSIPLQLKVKVPVRVKLGSLKLMKVKFRVKCNLVVDSLSDSSQINISSSSCKFKFKL
ncbi:Late embryogenesis abundant protein, LEA_2 subgroup [Dillenia turbinata]|uniref:Late embryogenesis abundant protein, LEA_2 subgroup n=1 Tax=Dillenia turbinata TaxID=194707 RepID=A0AAN8V574_9MAGN